MLYNDDQRAIFRPPGSMTDLEDFENGCSLV